MSKDEEEEFGSLIPQAEVVTEVSRMAVVPVISFLCSVVTIVAPLIATCWTLLLPCAPPLSQLPSHLPILTQTCGSVSVLCGLATTLTYHFYMFQQRDMCPLNTSTFLMSLSAGLLSQTSFLLYCFNFASRPVIYLYLFLACSLLHASFTLTSLYDLRERQILSPSSPLLLYKATGLLVLLLSTGAVFLSALNFLHTPRPFSYLVILGHSAYTGCFYFDLRALSTCFRCSFGASEIATLRRVAV